jgi:hypothetical protein
MSDLYGKQQYKMAEAAIAYASNYLDGDKFRIHKNQVQALRDGRWEDVGNVRKCAEQWDRLNPRV